MKQHNHFVARFKPGVQIIATTSVKSTYTQLTINWETFQKKSTRKQSNLLTNMTAAMET